MAAPGAEPFDHTRLAAARLRAAELQPFLAMALYALTPVADASQPTFGVDEQWRLYVNPAKLSEWSVPEVAGVLLHEVGHVVRDHAGRARTAVITDPLAQALWNVAGDAEINDDLLEAGVTLPESPITHQTLSLPPHKVAEFYYAALAQRRKPPPEAPDCGSGCHGRDDPRLAAHGSLPLPPGVSEAGALLLRRRVAEEVLRNVARQPGSAGGGWTRWAQALLHPQLDWRRLLAATVKSSVAAIAGAADYSYSRPPRRRVPGVVLPSLRRPIPRVAVIIDTSASVDDRMLQLAWTEVHGCLRHLGLRRDMLTVYAADVTARRLTGPPRRHVALTGGGGTDMAKAISTALAARPAPDLAVVVTDGFTPWPAAKPHRDIVVALLPPPGAMKVTPPAPPAWARTVRVTGP